MKLFRGEDFVRTDQRRPSEYIAQWKKNHRIALNGTKVKSGRRWTRLWIEIEEKDVRELALALLERYREQDELNETVEKFLSAVEEHRTLRKT